MKRADPLEQKRSAKAAIDIAKARSFRATADSRPGTLTRRRRLERVWHCRGRDLVAIQQWVLEWNDLMSMEDQAALIDDQIAPYQ